jgi:KUP system potassium uptake protein
MANSVGRASRAGLALGALGVVFGDIGTSPLYALRECFAGASGEPANAPLVLGAVSLIIWLLVLVVCVKYVVFVMRADNKGEGGIMALVSLVERIGPKGAHMRIVLPFLAIIGAALLFSDGVVTPAITVLSAVEGLTVEYPGVLPYVVPLALLILGALFVVQSLGTGRIGFLFGPILLVWFSVLGILGAASVWAHPEILAALNPWYAVSMLWHHQSSAVVIVGAAFLAVTGVEMLYADMGHFGKRPIQIAWFSAVFPALLLNYLGQGAYLLEPGGMSENLFFRLCPGWLVLPLVCLATVASAIASQAVISGAFSLARQAVQLGFLPRLLIVHTSAHTMGQVYVPFVNALLLVVTTMLVAFFGHSSRLGGAYGIAVSADMVITTVLGLLICRKLWRAPFVVVVCIGALYLTLDLSLLGSNVVKIANGGWVVAVFAAFGAVMMTTWRTGRAFLRAKIMEESLPFAQFIADAAVVKPLRVKGNAVFLSANIGSTPRALIHNFTHNRVIHERTIVLAVRTAEVPVIPAAERAEVHDMGDGFAEVVLHYGFMETPHVPEDLRALSGYDLAPMQTTYFLGKETLLLSKRRTLFQWRKRLFRFMANNSLGAAAFYNLPPNRVVELGVQLEL